MTWLNDPYRNDHKFSDRQVWANIVDQDRSASALSLSICLLYLSVGVFLHDKSRLLKFRMSHFMRKSFYAMFEQHLCSLISAFVVCYSRNFKILASFSSLAGRFES